MRKHDILIQTVVNWNESYVGSVSIIVFCKIWVPLPLAVYPTTGFITASEVRIFLQYYTLRKLKISHFRLDIDSCFSRKNGYI